MRIDRIRVDAFGTLRGLDTGPSALDGLVVVLGPNEAGKSTLFTFLTTALYGFHPATRERNPHVPWGSDQARGTILVRLDGGGCAEVERTLRSQPAGLLTTQGRTTDLRNQPVPWVEHVPRPVFRQVFAITLGELAALDSETWARIQDKIIGSMGATDLRSAREAAEVLEREAGEIWRPSRRGNQRLRDLQAEIRSLRARRGAAQERDTQLRRLVVEREDLRLVLEQAREKRQIDRSEVERAQSLLPVKRQLQRLATLRRDGGSREALRGLPENPPARLSALRSERATLEEQLGELAAELAERDATIAAAAASAALLLPKREEILRLVARAAGASDRTRTGELEGELADVEARLDVAAGQALDRSWRDVPEQALADIPVELLRERISQAPATPAPEPEKPRGPEAWALLLVGVALLAWGLAADLVLAAAGGAAAVAAAATLWISRRGGPGRERQVSERHRTPGVATLLDNLPLRAEHAARPSMSLIDELARLRELSRRRTELRRAHQSAHERAVGLDDLARGLARELGRDSEPGAEAIARDLDRQLRDAERLEEAARMAERELGRLRRERDRLSERLSDLDAEAASLAARVRNLLPGDLAGSLEVALARLTAHGEADRIDSELRRAHPDLDVLRAQIEALDQAGHAWAVDDEAVARARARIEALDDEIEDLLRRAEALDGEISRLRDDETVDAVDSGIANLRAAEARLARERDRKWIVARLLRDADRRFRDEHQPDLLRRAGTYLGHLTGGRYERLVVDETDRDHPFQLVGRSLPAPVPLARPVSTGTLEQAYLSLRLAMVDHLDQGGERLPLFVDEIFVNWDRERRDRGLELLGDIARDRQVFVFTCHPSVATELELRGGRVVALERGG